MIDLKRINIFCGHYGCGKTNLVLNLALKLANEGRHVTVVDLDVINPYFRSGNYRELLEEKGIELIASQFSNTNLDLPALPAETYSIFTDSNKTVLIDVGGDDAGAFALGRFAPLIKKAGEYKVFCIVNRFRALTHNAEEACVILREIEAASHLSADCIINNSHLCSLTTENDIIEGYRFAREVSELCRLPLAATVCTDRLAQAVENDIPDIFKIDAIVKPPF